MSMDPFFIELQEAKAKIMELEEYIAHLEANYNGALDELQDAKKQLQKAKDFEKIAESAIEALSAKR